MLLTLWTHDLVESVLGQLISSGTAGLKPHAAARPERCEGGLGGGMGCLDLTPYTGSSSPDVNSKNRALL